MNSNFTMRDMAVTERPYEKCQQSGPSALNDAELLAVILRSGSRKENALVTAQRILNRHSVHKGLVGLKHLTLEELMSIDGIGHVKAINYIFTNPGLEVINLGTGVGYSVLDMVKAFGKACGKEIPYEIKPRRAGDIAMCYADPAKANRDCRRKKDSK